MPKTAYKSGPNSEANPSRRAPDVGDSNQHSLDPQELLSVLSDDYVQDILRTVGDEALPAREIASRLDISRPTVYRRLNRLEDLGLIKTSMEYHPEGHHRKTFTTAIQEFVLSFDSGELLVEQSES